MQLYDKNARLRVTENLRHRIGEVGARIEKLSACKEEAKAAADALTAMEAILRRMSMLAREAAKTEKRRPGLLEEFEHCRGMVEELAHRAVLDGKSILKEDSAVNALLDSLELEPG